MTASVAQARRWTRSEFRKMATAGIIHPEDRLELIEGEIVEMTPQSSLHSTAVRKAEEALRVVFSSGYDVRAQLPLALGSLSEPEPDVAVVAGRIDDYRDAHPTTAVLVVEVADSSLAHDQQLKAKLYASSDISEYWIVNLVDNCLEVHRDPVQGAYRSRSAYGQEDSLTPVAKPEASIPISALLP